MSSGTTHDGFWTPHGNILLEVDVISENSPIYNHDTDYEMLDYVQDYVYIKCEVLNLKKDQLRQCPYRADINGVIKLIWYSHLSRVDDLPIFFAESISDEEWKSRNRFSKLNDIL